MLNSVRRSGCWIGRFPYQIPWACAVVLATVTIVPPAIASNWSGLSPFNSNWTDIANWLELAAPSNNGTEEVDFGNSPAHQLTSTVDSNFNINRIVFTSDDDGPVTSAPSFTINGGSTMTLSGDLGILQESTSSQTITAPIKLNASPTVFVRSYPGVGVPDNKGKLTIGGSVNTNGKELKVVPGAAGVEINGIISGSGGLSMSGPGTLTLGAPNTYTGDTLVLDGKLRLTGGGRLSDQVRVSVSVGATLEYNAITDAMGELHGLGTVNLQNGAQLVVGNYAGHNSVGNGDFRGVIQGDGGLSKRGTTGTLTLRGQSTYDGFTRVEEGTLMVASPGGLPDTTTVIVEAGGVLQYTGASDTINRLVGAGVVDLSTPSVLTLSEGEFRGRIEGAGGLLVTKEGVGAPLFLYGASTYTGGTRVEGVALFVRNTTGSATGFGPVSVANLGGILGGGQIIGDVLVEAGGHVRPESDGISDSILNVDGAFSQSDGTLEIFIAGLNGPGEPGGHAQLVVTGDAHLDGTLSISPSRGYTPSVGGTAGQTLDSFTILTANSISGEFEEVVGRHLGSSPFLDGSYFWEVAIGNADVTLKSFQAVAGDGNGDGAFDQFDIIQVLEAAKYNTGERAMFGEGDWNGDGVFDQLDIIAALGTGLYNTGPYLATTQSSNVPPVPEPSTFALAAIGLVSLLIYAGRPRLSRL